MWAHSHLFMYSLSVPWQLEKIRYSILIRHVFLQWLLYKINQSNAQSCFVFNNLLIKLDDYIVVLKGGAEIRLKIMLLFS